MGLIFRPLWDEVGPGGLSGNLNVHPELIPNAAWQLMAAAQLLLFVKGGLGLRWRLAGRPLRILQR